MQSFLTLTLSFVAFLRFSPIKLLAGERDAAISRVILSRQAACHCKG
ncbi:hypothetical protein ApDm4_1995 [Acetobacter pomorum]|nr:hypothetical protein ApDm4_1995 [Acetobacter pomorum]